MNILKVGKKKETRNNLSDIRFIKKEGKFKFSTEKILLDIL